jgi:hypothetical protein
MTFLRAQKPTELAVALDDDIDRSHGKYFAPLLEFRVDGLECLGL